MPIATEIGMPMTSSTMKHTNHNSDITMSP
jgi:hypothetical protein